MALPMEPKLKHRVTLLLFFAVFACLDNSPVFAQDADKPNQTEYAARPEASPEPKSVGKQ
jgi:hypothetical protein